jgi:hypothetical protein
MRWHKMRKKAAFGDMAGGGKKRRWHQRRGRKWGNLNMLWRFFCSGEGGADNGGNLAEMASFPRIGRKNIAVRRTAGPEKLTSRGGLVHTSIHG